MEDCTRLSNPSGHDIKEGNDQDTLIEKSGKSMVDGEGITTEKRNGNQANAQDNVWWVSCQNQKSEDSNQDDQDKYCEGLHRQRLSIWSKTAQQRGIRSRLPSKIRRGW